MKQDHTVGNVQPDFVEREGCEVDGRLMDDVAISVIADEMCGTIRLNG